jgi:hypothetical protein
MQETCSSGSVEGVMGNHDSYSDFQRFSPAYPSVQHLIKQETRQKITLRAEAQFI